MSITAARAMARQARRYGHFDTGTTLWIKCPQCRDKVEIDKIPNRSITLQLDAMMVDHLVDYCGQS